MAIQNNGKNAATIALAICIWGALWGIFETTFGYLLHLLPINLGWLVWYPVACFFMANVYRKTRKTQAVLWVGLLAAAIKLLNLLLPGRIDRVINPAVSIVLEASTMAIAFWVVMRLKGDKPLSKATTIVGMNTLWRSFYMLYLLWLVPDWMREISVINSVDAFLTFFVAQNLATSAILIVGALAKTYIFRPIINVERKIASWAIPKTAFVWVKALCAVLLLGVNIILQFALR